MAVNSKSTKDQILTAYQETLKQVKDMEKQLKAKPQVVEKKEVVRTKGPTTKDVVEDLGSLKVAISQNLSAIERDLLFKVQALEELEEQITQAKRELEEVNEIKVNAQTLESLLVVHNQKKEEFEVEITKQRQAWEEEKSRKEKEEKELAEIKAKTRQREEQDYQDRIRHEREMEKRKYEEGKQAIEKKWFEEKDRVAKEIDERFTKLKEKEQHLSELEARVEVIDQEVEMAVEAAVIKTTEELERKHNSALELINERHSGAINLLNQSKEVLEKQVKKLEAENERLQTKLSDAMGQVKDIATKVVEGPKTPVFVNSGNKEDK